MAHTYIQFRAKWNSKSKNKKKININVRVHIKYNLEIKNKIKRIRNIRKSAYSTYMNII